MKRVLACGLLLACLIPRAWAAEGPPSISAASAILVDADSGRVLYEHNANQERLIASITKLMTALVAVESTPDLDQLVEIQREYTLTEGSSMYLKVGEAISLKNLLYGLLLASGNDAALAIAGGCAGEIETFVDWMNQRAKDLGMEHTHFANPNGLNAEGHYSTAADMAKLAAAVLDQPVLAQIVATKSITVADRTLVNHNKLLWRYEGCTGMKTGYTDKAGRTLVSSAERNGQRLIVVTLHDPNDWADHAALLDYGFSHYPRHILARAGKVFQTVPVTGSLNRFVSVETAGPVFYPLTAAERVRAEVVLPTSVQAPLERGAIAGRLVFYLDSVPIGETYLLYSQDIREDTAQNGNLFGRLLSLFRGEAAVWLAWTLPVS
ncbi:MAG: D-alanyl-D-alanine carboxypeptidase [Oscillospiraceae bacterium]|nr:D-alanyl-D-alanine carboxypeptidase [Oscillospiraceae bacterium]